VKADAVVDAEAGVRPGAHLVDRLLVELALLDEQAKDFVPPCGEQ
jgi:hypothetical protein